MCEYQKHHCNVIIKFVTKSANSEMSNSHHFLQSLKTMEPIWFRFYTKQLPQEAICHGS